MIWAFSKLRKKPPLRLAPSSAGSTVTVRIDVLKELEAVARFVRKFFRRVGGGWQVVGVRQKQPFIGVVYNSSLRDICQHIKLGYKL